MHKTTTLSQSRVSVPFLLFKCAVILKTDFPEAFSIFVISAGFSITAQKEILPYMLLRVIFSEYRESEDTHEKSIFLSFHQNIPLGELIQGKIV